MFLTVNLYAQNWPMVDACKERTSWANLETQLGPPLKKTVVFSLNGEIVWQSDNPRKYCSSLAVDVFSTNAMAITDSYLWVSVWENAHGKGEIHTLDRSNGHGHWHYTFDTTGAYSPIIADGIVYVISGRSYDLWGFDITTGLDVFFDDSEKFLKQPIVADGKLFVAAFGKVVAFENYAIGTDKMPADLQRSPELLQNWPNPFRQSTSIRFHLVQPEDMDISVFDLTGRTISVPRYEAGTHILTWDGTTDSRQRLASGTYILRLTSKDNVRSNRMLLLE